MVGPMVHGYGALCQCQRYAVKVTILMVTSVSNPDVMPWPMRSPHNPEVTICPCPIGKVTIFMVTSLGNLDVTSHLLHKKFCWMSGCHQMPLFDHTSWPDKWWFICSLCLHCVSPEVHDPWRYQTSTFVIKIASKNDTGFFSFSSW